MSDPISSELKNWFLSLGFQDKNLISEQIEEEFRRLAPPELRDIWRNIMIHVVPVQEARRIRKALLLNQLKKNHANRRIRPCLPKNVKNVGDFEQHRNNEDILVSLGKVHQSIIKNETEVDSLKTKVMEKEIERKKLLKSKEHCDHVYILIDMKMTERENTIVELSETHTFLSYINSFWHFEKDSQEMEVVRDRLEIIKSCLKLVNEFGRQRNLFPEDEIIKEKDSLMESIVKLTSKIPASNLYKIVVDMLKDTLSSLLKLCDHVNPKQESENVWLFDSQLLNMKKECVHSNLKNKEYQKQVKAHGEKVNAQKLELLDLLSNYNFMGFRRENLKIWLDSECEKQLVVTRHKYLSEEIEEIRAKNKISDFSSEQEQKEFLITIKDSKNQLLLLEQEIANNLSYLSDEPINAFINCQEYCISRIRSFIEKEKSLELTNFPNTLAENLTDEVFELSRLDLPLIVKNLAGLDNNNDSLPYYYINVLAEQCYYLIYLSNAHKKLAQSINHPVVKSETLIAKKKQIEQGQETLSEVLKKSIVEAKNNLQNVEHYAAECSQNIDLWLKLSVNEIIPKTLMVADRSFVDWLKRYVSVIQCLRKKKANNQRDVVE